MDDLKNIGRRIREARKKKNLSQARLSEMIDISTSHLSDLENGKTNISLDIFMRITESLQVSADWLLQTNIPQVSAMQSSEFSKLLSDCSSSEVQSILRMVREMKTMLRNNNQNE